MYAILAIFILLFSRIENKDIHCPTLTSTQKECDEGGGMAFSHTKPNEGDTCKTLINKIYKAAGAEQASVKWRKAIGLSFAIMIVMWVLVGCMGERTCFTFGGFHLPDWRTFYVSVLIGFTILLGSYLYYSFHVYGVAEAWIKEAIQELEAKGCIVNK